MKSNRLKRMVSALALAGLVIPAAAAADPSGWYIGAGAGQSRAKIDENLVTSDLLASGFMTSEFNESDRDFGYKFLAGYRFNNSFALEGGYFDLGKLDYLATTEPAGTLQGDVKFGGWNLDLVGMLPVSERSTVFARLGAQRSKANASFASTSAVNIFIPGQNFTATNYKLGVGIQYSLTDALALRIEAERYRVDDAVGNRGDVGLLSAGLVYHFRPAAPAPARPAQTPVAPPPSEPVLVEVPLPAATEEYCSLLDIQFEIAQDTIQRAEQEKLRSLATFLQRHPETSAAIRPTYGNEFASLAEFLRANPSVTATMEGHTDNASPDMAQTICRQRAQSVADYLVEQFNIDRSRLSVQGFGATRRFNYNTTAGGRQENRRVNIILGYPN